MKPFPTRSTAVVAVAALLIAGAVLSCAKTAGTIRKFTYPPEFKYIETSEVRASMRKLAGDVHALNRILGENAELSPDQHREVLRLLASIEKTAAGVDPHGRSTNQPLLQRNIADFRRDIAEARRAAEQDPPNYYLAGTTVGSCLLCHREGSGR
jgi:hypothetical protein